MDIPTGGGIKGKFPLNPTRENIAASVGQLPVEAVHHDHKPGFWRGCCCTFCVLTEGRVAMVCLDEEVG